MAKIDRERTPEEIAQGLRIRAFRIKLGYKRAEDFADDHDFARSQVSMWENGVRPGRPNLEKLAKALKVKPSDIGPAWVPTGRPKNYEPKPKSVEEPTRRSLDDTLVTAVVGSSPTRGGFPALMRGVIDMDRYPQPELLGPFLAMWCEMGEQGRLACFHTAVAQVAPISARPLAKTGKL